MKQKICAPSVKVPTANLAVNKSRIKLYNKEGDLPTYYLQKGQEFQIELFNPTTDTLLAKITLNGNVISQGGLVINPGQRVFLDRYLDVAKKFLFDTYEVSGSQEVKEAIKNNGDFKVEFYKETKPRYYLNTPMILGGPNYNQGIIRFDSPSTGGYVHNTTTQPNTPMCNTTSTLGLTGNITNTASFHSSSANVDYSSSLSTASFCDNSATLDWMQTEKSSEPIKHTREKRSKSIETGRVEKGSHSDQTFKTVDKDFEWFAFHTIEAKLLPVSQKVNTTADINVKVYCTNCGAKLGKGHKFCSTCGTKA